jgi:FixJ family two-component response regulator
MTGRHVVLVVEDDRPIAEDLEQILKSLQCDSVVVDNKSDALAAVQRQAFCLVLLDLEIKAELDSIKGHEEHGKSLLRDIRRLHPDHLGTCHWLPIVIVSGFAREVGAAVEVMKDGASDVIQKPFKSQAVSKQIRSALDSSGRTTHERCAVMPPQSPAVAGDHLVLAVPGDHVGRRTLVTVGARPAHLTDSSLKVLLQLLVAHAEGSRVHKTELGATNDQGFKGVSVLREALKAAAGAAEIILNDHHGNYWLAGNVTIGPCGVEKLVALEDVKVTELANKLGRLLKPRRRKV